MEYEKLIEFLKYLKNFCVNIRRDAVITDSEVLALYNEFRHFKKLINKDHRIRHEFKYEIEQLFSDFNVKPERGFFDIIRLIFSGKHARNLEENYLKAISINNIEQRLDNLLHTITEEKVYW
jgi:hypothetical protein